MRSDYVHGYISRNVKSHKFEYLQSKSSSLRMIVIVDFGSEVQILPCLCMCREHIFKNTGKCYKPIQTMIWAGAATTVGGINIGVGVTNFCALRSASCWTTEEGRRSPGCLRVMSSHLSIYVQWKPDCCTSPDNLSYISSCCLRWATHSDIIKISEVQTGFQWRQHGVNGFAEGPLVIVIMIIIFILFAQIPVKHIIA